jgi:hypothetical protein
MTRCNFCTLREIRENAARNSLQVLLDPAPEFFAPAGVNVFVVPADLDILAARASHDTYWTSWFMELPEQCAC